MPHTSTLRLLALLAIIGAFGVATPNAEGCKVPVFRYGLEHWIPDPYQVVVLHRGKLAGDAETLTAKLEAAAEDLDKPANLEVVRMNVDELDKADDETLDEVLGTDYREKVNAPEIVLLYPRESYSGPLVWRGALTADNIDAIVDSPVRRKITKMILDGESAVWVMVGNGDATKDKAAAEMLQKEFAVLEKNLEMRDVEVIESDSKFGEDTAVELRLGFKLIVLDAKDPKEKVFLKMLMRSEADLEDFGEPVAIPIFGRGRSYLSLAGKGINPDMIAETCAFLVGDCGCEVKRQNPGVDLLFAVNWDEAIVGTADVEQPLPELAGIGSYDELVSGQTPVDTQALTATAVGAASSDTPQDINAVALAKPVVASQATSTVSPPSAAPGELVAVSSSFAKHLTLWIVGLIGLGAAIAAMMTFRLKSQAD